MGNDTAAPALVLMTWQELTRGSFRKSRRTHGLQWLQLLFLVLQKDSTSWNLGIWNAKIFRNLQIRPVTNLTSSLNRQDRFTTWDLPRCRWRMLAADGRDFRCWRHVGARFPFFSTQGAVCWDWFFRWPVTKALGEFQYVLNTEFIFWKNTWKILKVYFCCLNCLMLCLSSYWFLLDLGRAPGTWGTNSEVVESSLGSWNCPTQLKSFASWMHGTFLIPYSLNWEHSRVRTFFFPFIDSYQGPLKTDDFGADLHFHSFSKTTKLIQNQCVFAVHWQVWVEYHIHHWSARVAPIHTRPSACSANVGGSWRRCVFGQTSQNSGICGVGVGSKKIMQIQRVLQSCFVFVLTPRQARSERNDDHWVFSSVTSLNNPDISWKSGIRNNFTNWRIDIKISQIHSEEYLYFYCRVLLVPSTCKGVGFQWVSSCLRNLFKCPWPVAWVACVSLTCAETLKQASPRALSFWWTVMEYVQVLSQSHLRSNWTVHDMSWPRDFCSRGTSMHCVGPLVLRGRKARNKQNRLVFFQQ